MANLAHIKYRNNDALFSKFHGFEYGENNVAFAVMERRDGKAEMVGMDTLYLIHRNYEESKKLPNITSEHPGLLASENALVEDVGFYMNDLRTASFSPQGTTQKAASRPTSEFIAAAPSFPPAIAEEAAAVWQKFTGTTLANPLKTGPVRS